MNIRFLTLCLLGLLMPLVVKADYTRIDGGISTLCKGVNITVRFFDKATVHVLKQPVGFDVSNPSLVVPSPNEDVEKSVKLSVKEKDNSLTVASSVLTAQINLTTGTVSYYADDKLLTSETSIGQFDKIDDMGTDALSVSMGFSVEEHEPIYGLGILQNGKMSQRGQSLRMIQGNTDNVVTMFQSIKGYGIYWDNYSPTQFTDNTTSLSFSSEIADGIDYYFLYGGSADGVIAQMRRLTGQVPMVPLWAYGYMQSRERYTSQQELNDVVKKYRDAGVPLDCIIQDWQYWTNNYLWNAMDFLAGGYPDPKKMMDDLHGENVHMLISVWPSFGVQTHPYKELSERGYLYPFGTFPPNGAENGKEGYPSGVAVYDAFTPEAVDIYWKYLKRLKDYGIDGWWMDSTEPDQYSSDEVARQSKAGNSTFQRLRNAYPLVAVGGIYDRQRQDDPNKRVLILTRCAFAGQQRTGANTWSGDVVSTWESLRKQLTAGLNFTMVGNPNYNSDIGGFYCGDYNRQGGDAPRHADFQELYLRWLQMNTFNPMMRSHGTHAPREIYEFGNPGDAAYEAIASAIRLRYSLLPYIYSTAWQVTNDNGSFMRPLMMDFADDSQTHDMGEEFMFGKSLLVAPILYEQYTSKGDSKADFTEQKQTKIYLPQGTDWWDFFDNSRYNGGQELTLSTTLSSIPLMVKAGSIIPIGPDVQYSTEVPWDSLTIKVYPGANGEFTLYEDEFDNYNYEQGQYTEIPFTWNEKSQTLNIGKRTGSYDGMLQQRTFNVLLPDGRTKTVNYTGKPLKVKL